MSDHATKNDLKDLRVGIRADIKSAIEDLSEIIGTFAQQVDDRFNKVEQEIGDIKLSLDRLTNTVDGFVGRIDSYEQEMRMRDKQFDRLLEWARKVSDKTGIPLENL